MNVMKSLLMIAALMVGISYSSDAQQKTKHKSKTTHAKTSTKTLAKADCKDCKTGKASYTSKTVALGGREATWNRLLTCSKAKRVAAAKKAPATVAAVTTETRVTQPAGLCYSYRKNNILVTECPDLMSSPGQLEMISQGTYGGYYPNPRIGTIATVNPAVVAPQSPNVNTYKGPAPQSGSIIAPNVPPNRR